MDGWREWGQSDLKSVGEISRIRGIVDRLPAALCVLFVNDLLL